MPEKVQKSTAILVFANSSSVDGVRKGIPNSKALFTALNADIVQKVKKTNLPFLIYNEELQIGSDFGTRFTTAIQSVFAKGFESVIAVGNDTPNLTVAGLMRSYEEVKKGKTVIGPSLDGGIYLIGVHVNRFDATTFRELPWEQRNLFEETARQFMRKGMLHQLPRLGDIDVLKDVEQIILLRNSISKTLITIFLQIIRSKNPITRYTANLASNTSVWRAYNKGSPLFSF